LRRKKRGLTRNFLGARLAASPGLWLPRQFTLFCSTGFYITTNIAVLPEMEGDQEKKPTGAMLQK
jgi:hypothetical protein